MTPELAEKTLEERRFHDDLDDLEKEFKLNESQFVELKFLALETVAFWGLHPRIAVTIMSETMKIMKVSGK